MAQVSEDLMIKIKKEIENMEDTKAALGKAYREVCDFALEVGGDKFKRNSELFQEASENQIENLDGLCEDMQTTVREYEKMIEDAN